ncbi:MAG: hypothetical protein AAFN10_18235, partial [Bacteroidota bacterium]
MKAYFLICLFFIPLLGNAQNSTEEVKRLLDESLRTHVLKIHPPKGCECNECAHTYTKGFKITKHQEVAGVLRVYGLAKVQYKNAFTGGTDTIDFYAEFRKVEGETVLIRLRWRKNDCMKYKTLYELAG